MPVVAIIGTHTLVYTSEPEAVRSVTMRLPGGADILLYEPRHKTAFAT